MLALLGHEHANRRRFEVQLPREAEARRALRRR